MLIYFVFFVGITYAFYWKDINALMRKIFKKKIKVNNSEGEGVAEENVSDAKLLNDNIEDNKEDNK